MSIDTKVPKKKKPPENSNGFLLVGSCPTESYKPLSGYMWRRRDSNPEPKNYEFSALTD